MDDRAVGVGRELDRLLRRCDIRTSACPRHRRVGVHRTAAWRNVAGGNGVAIRTGWWVPHGRASPKFLYGARELVHCARIGSAVMQSAYGLAECTKSCVRNRESVMPRGIRRADRRWCVVPTRMSRCFCSVLYLGSVKLEAVSTRMCPTDRACVGVSGGP